MVTPEALHAVQRMRECATSADRARDKAFAIRDATKDKVIRQVMHGTRHVLDGDSKTVAEKVAQEDPGFRANVSDNQWYIQQTIMWASVAEVELKIGELDEQTLTSLRQVNPSRT